MITSPREPASNLRKSCTGTSTLVPNPYSSETNHPPCAPGT